MADFFSLGGPSSSSRNPDRNNTNHDQQPQSDTNIPPETLFWYKNNEDGMSSFKGSSSFELWQHHQQQQLQHHHHYQQHHHLQQLQLQQDLYASAAALGVGPSSINVSDESSSRPFMLMRPSSFSGGGEGAGGSNSGSTISCEDCGNQAKKDCVHMRCRTCCKSRGFDCATHVKSTWVPASKRRERQHRHLTALQQQQNQQHEAIQVIRGEGENPKRLRESHNNNPSSNSSMGVGSHIVTATSGLEVGKFPPELEFPAMFRCVRVSSIDDDDDDQYAYQTAVNIAGHTFKGILYNHGPADQNSNYNMSTGGESSSGGGGGGGGGGGVIQPLNLINAAPTSGGVTVAAAAASGLGTLMDPNSLYPPNPFMGSGTQFFLPPRS